MDVSIQWGIKVALMYGGLGAMLGADIGMAAFGTLGAMIGACLGFILGLTFHADLKLHQALHAVKHRVAEFFLGRGRT